MDFYARRLRFSRATIARTAVLALAVTGLVAVEARTPVQADSCATEMSSISLAVAEAARCGTQVEISSNRTETDQIYALPEGTLALESYASPQRVHKPDGSWAAVDTTLVHDADSSYRPVASSADVHFSGGGTAPLARFTVGGGTVTYTWPSALPAPIMSGDSVTYPNVFPNVDLRLTASSIGFSYSLVVKTAAAGASVSAVTVGLSATGLTIQPTSDGFNAVDGQGNVAVSSGGAIMWDAFGMPAGTPIADLATSAPDEAHVRNITVQATATSLTVRPDLTLFSDPTTVFPVIVDPAQTLTSYAWGYASNATRNDGVARVGLNPDGSGLFRSFFRFKPGAVVPAGATVTGANFSISLTHSYACTNTPVNAYSVAYFSASGKLPWSGPAILSWIGARSGHAHKPSGGAGCSNDPQPNQTLIWDDASVRTGIQTNLNSGSVTFNVGLMERDQNGSGESTKTWWKKFNPTTARLYVAWNSPPGVPTATKAVASTTNCTAAGATLINTKRPLLCATPQDADSGTNRVEFEIWDSAHSTRQANSNGVVTNRTVGAVTSWGPAVDLADGAHAFRIQSCDAYACGAWSAWQPFTIDSVPPAIPAVAAIAGGTATYQPKSSGVWGGGVNVDGKFSFTAGSDATQIEYDLNGVPSGLQATTGGVLTKTLLPTRDGVNVLKARSQDAAGNTSPWTAVGSQFEFLVNPVPQKSWKWEFNGTLASLDSSGVDSYPVGGITPTYVAGQTSPSQAISFTGTQALTASGPVVDTKSSFTALARVRLGTTTPSGPMTIVSQDGTTGSGFRLLYRTDLDVDGDTVLDKAFCFTLFQIDGNETTTTSRSCLPYNDITTATWVTIAGVHDAVNHRVQIWLYIEAELQAEMMFPDTGFTNTWSATGALAIGRAKVSGAAAQFWNGPIDRVVVINKSLSQPELTAEMRMP